MRLELDHVFVCVSLGAPESELLQRFGLQPGSGRRHEGQGTRNVRYFFQNAYLELIWVDVEEEALSATTRPTGLWERSRWRQTGACPIGVALRAASQGSSAPPFDTWDYQPDYLPAGMAIPIAANSKILSEPLLFIVPSAEPPSAYPAGRAEPLDHPKGFREITALNITISAQGQLSPEIRSLTELGIAKIRSGSAPHLEMAFDSERCGEATSFEPEMPLSFRW